MFTLNFKACSFGVELTTTEMGLSFKGCIDIGSGKDSGKQLVFKKRKNNPKRIEAVHGASLPREFERQDMAKIFNKKIKTRFPILFKREVEFHMLKARGRI